VIKVRRIGWLLFVLVLMNVAGSLANPGQKHKLPWISPEEMSAKYVLAKRPIIVDVYTSWCYYCKVMDNTTWSNDSVINYVRDKFYTVKIDAESKQPLLWMGEKFEYIPKYKLNQLAIKLLQGNMVYPSTIIIPENGEPEILKGAFTAAEMEMLLKYYGDKWNETLTPESFQKKFRGNWK
jgi:thioredoxin-related protein